MIVLLILIIGNSFMDLFSQNIQPKPTRQSSLEAYSNGDFEKAYKEFNELLVTYSKDPLYKYYSGVCLVKLKRDPETAISLLQQAIQGASAVRSLPADDMFYLGRAQQMAGKFQEALVSYSTYTDNVGKKSAREQGVPDLVQQCIGKKGALSESEMGSAPDNFIKTEEVQKIDSKTAVNEIYNQPVEKQPSERIALPADYENLLDEALDFQFKADSIISLVSRQKKEYLSLSNSEKAVLKLKISENESLAASFQKSADQRYNDAQAAMNTEKQKAPQIVETRQSGTAIKDSISKSTVNNLTEAVKPAVVPILIEAGKQYDTTKEVVHLVSKPVEIFSIFEVLPKPIADPDEKILIDPDVPEGLIYRIQVAVFRNPVAPVYFKGIIPVYGFKVSGTDRTNYYAGMFRRSADAINALSIIKTKGFKDAFVVAFSANKSVSADRAAILEKEWGKRPFKTQNTSVQDTPADTVPPTLSFRVEIVRSLKPLEDDAVDKIKKMAGNRGLDIQPIDDGNIVYLVGKFITFESAAEYADLLVRNGYREAKVVAWLGKREIPVETARQLFDNL